MSPTPTPDTNTLAGVARPGLLRRLMALLYDLLVIAGIWIFSTFFLTGFNQMESIGPGNSWYRAFQAFLIASYGGFFVLFWTRNGQTLGMMAWRMVLEREDGTQLRWIDAIKRALCAPLSAIPLALGYLWIWIDPAKRTWHGRLSRTRIRLRPKR